MHAGIQMQTNMRWKSEWIKRKEKTNKNYDWMEWHNPPKGRNWEYNEQKAIFGVMGLFGNKNELNGEKRIESHSIPCQRGPLFNYISFIFFLSPNVLFFYMILHTCFLFFVYYCLLYK